LPASPVSRMSVGQFICGRRVDLGQGSCSPPVRVGSTPLSNALCVSPDPVVSNRSPACFQTSGHRLGSVDGWLCQKSYKSLGMPLPDFRLLACSSSYGSSPPEGCMGRAFCRRFTAGEVSPRTTPWGTQWGQFESVPRNEDVLCTFAARDWSQLFSGWLPALYILSPFVGGCARAPRRPGRRLLPG
jgi:hypothetical protein